MVALHTAATRAGSLRTELREARPRRVAVMLNVNARKVDGGTLRWVRGVVPREDLFLSWTLTDAPRIAERVVGEGYDAVLLGGGDGTFANGVAALANAARHLDAPVPDVGVLRLGTGNAMADAIGAAPATADGLAGDLRRARRAPSRRRLSLLEVEGRPAMFCGFGLDAQILDDLHAVMRLLNRARLADRVSSAAVRYFLAVAGRSVPRFALSARTEVVAVNRGAPAIKVDVDGKPIGAPIPNGRVLWRGPASLASAATIPYFGLGMKMFPHAGRERGRFQLRLSDAGVVEILSRLPVIWQGRYQSPRIHDFLVERVELVLSRPAPFQSNGDLVGDRSRLDLGLWQQPVAVV